MKPDASARDSGTLADASGSESSLRTLLNAEHRLGFGLVVQKLFVFRSDGLVRLGAFGVPLARLFVVAELPMCHGQEEPIISIAAFTERHRLIESFDSAMPIA